MGVAVGHAAVCVAQYVLQGALVAGMEQKIGGECVAKVVEAEVNYSCAAAGVEEGAVVVAADGFAGFVRAGEYMLCQWYLFAVCFELFGQALSHRYLYHPASLDCAGDGLALEIYMLPCEAIYAVPA